MTRSRSLDRDRLAESGTVIANALLARNESMIKDANVWFVCSVIDQHANLKEFFYGAWLVRRNYQDWLRLVENPETNEYHSLVFFKKRPWLVFTLWLSARCGVFMLDPSCPFTSHTTRVPSDQKTISLGEAFNGGHSAEVRKMWRHLGKPWGVYEYQIDEVARYKQRYMLSTPANPEDSPRPISLKDKTTTEKMLIRLYGRQCVPINVDQHRGCTLDYQAFLDRSAVVLAMEKNSQMDYLRIVEDLLPFCVESVVKRFRKRSINTADQVDHDDNDCFRGSLTSSRDPQRNEESNIVHFGVLKLFRKDPSKYIDDEIFAGPMDNQINVGVTRNMKNTKKKVNKASNNSGRSSRGTRPSTAQGLCCRKRPVKAGGTTKAQVSTKETKRPRLASTVPVLQGNQPQSETGSS